MGVAIRVGWSTSHERISREHRPSQITVSYSGSFFLQACDGKFTDEDLNDEGNAFVPTYFDFQTGKYLADYEKTIGTDLPQLYYVKDTWENFDSLKLVLDNRLAEWRKTKRGAVSRLASWMRSH